MPQFQLLLFLCSSEVCCFLLTYLTAYFIVLQKEMRAIIPSLILALKQLIKADEVTSFQRISSFIQMLLGQVCLRRHAVF